jgi:hypothetical protein
MTRLGLATAALALAFFSGLTVAAAQGAPPAQDEPNTLQNPDAPPIQRAPAARAASRYFIDFRARSALSYGHTFVVFGRVGERLTPRNVAGLHPKGNSSLTYIIGHLLPVDSETGASDGDLDEQYTTARFRVWLSASEYHSVVRHIRELQASSPAWHIPTFNCNAFVGVIANLVGLTSPPTWLFPGDFVNSMRRMNEGHRRYASAPSARDAMARVPNRR